VYRIVFTKRSLKTLRRIPKPVADQIRLKLAEIAREPYASHPNARKLQGRSGYRLRVGDWRVIYEIQNDELVILVLKIGSRGEIYR
jgi:mRNA interferase RelE/StbE